MSDQVAARGTRHYRRPRERHLDASDERRVTFVFQNISRNHGAAFRNLVRAQGFRFILLPREDARAQRFGLQHVSRGQCYPVVYSVGSLVAFIVQELERGLSKQDIIDRYVFCTVSSAGSSCRFQMYEEEYRKALRNLGMEDFRVEIVSLGRKRIADPDAYQFPASFVNALFMGFVLGDVMTRRMLEVRPYETDPGATDRVFADLRESVGRDCRTPEEIIDTLSAARTVIDTIPTDTRRRRPKVLVTGEIYCAMSDGHISADFFHFLEREGMEVVSTTFSDYLIFQSWRGRNLDRLRFRAARRKGPMDVWTHLRKRLHGTLKERHIAKLYVDFGRAIGLQHPELDDLRELIAYSAPYYHKDIYGGEGFLEIAKHIKAHVRNEAQLVISLKPFTCMPSVCSDAVQTKVEQDLPESIFLAIEIDGNGVTNMQSRVAMKIHEAKERFEAQRRAGRHVR